MPYFTYDTSVIISRKLRRLDGMPGKFLMSAIVLMELTGSSGFLSRIKAKGAIRSGPPLSVNATPCKKRELVDHRVLCLVLLHDCLIQQSVTRAVVARH